MVALTRRHLLQGIAAGTAASVLGMPAVRAQTRPDLRIGVNGLPRTLEPVNAIGNAGVRIVNHLYDTPIVLFSNGAQGDGIGLVPGLAESWEPVDDKTLRLKLRKGVKFHNGVEMTAEDVAFTFSGERLWGEAALKSVPNGRALSPDFDEPVVEDPYSVLIRTKTPSHILDKFVASWIGRVVPAAHYKEVGAEAFGNTPIGTGPYRFVEFRAGDRVVLEAFDDYWGDKPTANQIIFQMVPETSTRVAGLISGEYDIVTTLTPDDIDLVAGYSDLETRGMNIENFHMFVFNMNHPLFQQKTLRKAMALAVDRKLLSDALWKGKAAVPRGRNFPHYGASYDPNRDFFRHDPEEARKLVAESGYDGSPIAYNLDGNYYANAVPAMMMMIDMWKSVGINVLPQNVAFGTVPDKDIAMRAWSNGMALTDAVTTIVTEFGPGRQVQTKFGWKAPDEFNQLATKLSQSPDGPERLAGFNRMRDIFEDETPAVPLYQPFDIYGVRKNLEWKPISFESMELRANNLRFG